jgi:hypothetical protein
MPAEWAQLRQIMYQPSTVWLSTENSGDRWLTDQFVLINVTGESAILQPAIEGIIDSHSPGGVEWPDGPYKLTASDGLKPRESVPEPDIEAWFTRAAESKWRRVRPTEWSVAEHPGKAMLWAYAHAGGNAPCLFGESTWTALKRHHPEVVVEYARDLNLFRFSEVTHDASREECGEGRCVHPWVPFCYAAGIRVPEGQEDAAVAVAALFDATSNGGIDLSQVN